MTQSSLQSFFLAVALLCFPALVSRLLYTDKACENHSKGWNESGTDFFGPQNRLFNLKAVSLSADLITSQTSFTHCLTKLTRMERTPFFRLAELLASINTYTRGMLLLFHAMPLYLKVWFEVCKTLRMDHRPMKVPQQYLAVHSLQYTTLPY